MTDLAVYNKNKNRADELQRDYGLTETLHDLFAWEELTESEAVGIQQYKDRMHPKYTGDYESDVKLQEAFDKEYAAWNLDENQLTDPKAMSLYKSCCLDLDEAFELQRLRAIDK